MECKSIFIVIALSNYFTQVSVGFLPIGGSAVLFPGQSASCHRRIAEIAG